MAEEDVPQSGSADEETELMTPPTGGGSILPQSATPLRETIGDYEVLAKLGAGGMGAVYRAEQVSLGRTVALKILPAHMIEDEESIARFQREARVAAALTHPNLVRVYAAGEAAGCHFIAMELIEGEDLGRRLKRDGALPAPEALRITVEVTRGLDHAWRTAHLIHRDIKPANIFLAADGAVKVGDLGLAKSTLGSTTGLTQTGTMMGTPHYISPEQARADKDIDFRADIYSLGCTLYHMLTGHVPYAGTDPMTIMLQHINAPLPAIMKAWPQCPIPLARLVGRMLKKSRHERPASYAELIGQIETVWAQIDPLSFNPEAFAPPALDHPTPTPTPTRPAAENAYERSPDPEARGGRPLPSKSKLSRYCAAAVAILLLVLGGFFFLLRTPNEEKLTQAQLYAKQKEEDRGRVAATTGLALPPVAPTPSERWQRVLDHADDHGSSQVTYWQDGWISKRAGGATGTRFIGEEMRDGGIRAEFRWSPGSKILLGLRERLGEAGYHLTRVRETVRLYYADRATGQTSLLQEHSTPIPAPGEIFSLEFRAVGPLLLAKLNGVELFRTEVPRVAMGRARINFDEAIGVRNIEILNLDAPAAAVTPAAEPWEDLLAQPERLTLRDGAEHTTDGLLLPDRAVAIVEGSSGDVAVRLHGVFSEKNLVIRARARGNPSSGKLVTGSV